MASAYEEYVKQSILKGKHYEELPPRIQQGLSKGEWELRAKSLCIQRGYNWSNSLARLVCEEHDYYEELLKAYKAWLRLYPYHLVGYIARVMRVTPHAYYADILTACLAAEKPYHQLPNFTAADIVRVLGWGRNEYIAGLNSCKGRRLMWRVSKAAVAREVVPNQPPEGGGEAARLAPWWTVQVNNIGESEFRELSAQELAHLKTASVPLEGHVCRVGDLQAPVLAVLLRKGLVSVEVPVGPTDRFSIPPLEGFVSNRDAAGGPLGAQGTGGGAPGADPLEAALYGVLLANSERLTVAELASILGVELQEVAAALSVACRLGFATRIGPDGPGSTPSAAAAVDAAAAALGLLGREGGGGSGGAAAGEGGMPGGEGAALDLGDGGAGEAGDAESDAAGSRLVAQLMAGRGPAGPGAGAAGGTAGAAGGAVGGTGTAAGAGASAVPGAVAIVLDAEATSFLMMGALSPGLKRHAVTLFEGGRVAGAALVEEMVGELWASFAAGQAFEGDMARLTQFAGALATVLDVAREVAALGVSVPLAVELLRKESLAGLLPVAAAKVLSTAYVGLLPVTPLPHPPLPIAPERPGAPAYFGPAGAAASPWLPLALYAASRCGPVSLVLPAGQRVWRLPEPLETATHALLWPWDEDAAKLRGGVLGSLGSSGGGGGAGAGPGPLLVEGPFLLAAINELLTRTAIMVQPLNVLLGSAGSTGGAAAGGGTGGRGAGPGRQGSLGGIEEDVVAEAVAAAGQAGTQAAGVGLVDLGAIVDVPLPLPAPLLQVAASAAAQGSSSVGAPAAAWEQGQGQGGTSAAGGGADLPSPSPSVAAQALVVVRGLDRKSNASVDVPVQASVLHALHELGLAGVVGYLRLVRLPGSAGGGGAGGGLLQHTAGVTTSILEADPAALPSLLSQTGPGLSHASSQLGMQAQAQSAAAGGSGGGSGGGASATGTHTGAAGNQQAGDSMQASRQSSLTRVSVHSTGSSAGGAGASESVSRAAAAALANLPSPGSTQAQAAGGASSGALHASPGRWVPLTVSMGVPMYCLPLCKAVCDNARSAAFLAPAGLAAQRAAQRVLASRLHALVSQFSLLTAPAAPVAGAAAAAEGQAQYGAAGLGLSAGLQPQGAGAGGADSSTGSSSTPMATGAASQGLQGQGQEAGGEGQQQAQAGSSVQGPAAAAPSSFAPPELPIANLLFDGSHLMPLDVSGSVQGGGVSCIDGW